MNANELAKWLSEEHEKVREIIGRMNENVAVVPRTNKDQWIERVRDSFDHLRAHQIKHMALEERDGYMLPVVNRRPAFGLEVDRLAHEHVELRRIMDGIHEELCRLQSGDALLIRDCCRRIGDLVSYIEQHDADENRLLLTAFTEDIGTEG